MIIKGGALRKWSAPYEFIQMIAYFFLDVEKACNNQSPLMKINLDGEDYVFNVQTKISPYLSKEEGGYGLELDGDIPVAIWEGNESEYNDLIYRILYFKKEENPFIKKSEEFKYKYSKPDEIINYANIDWTKLNIVTSGWKTWKTS